MADQTILLGKLQASEKAYLKKKERKQDGRQIKVLAIKPIDLSLIPKNHKVEGKDQAFPTML